MSSLPKSDPRPPAITPQPARNNGLRTRADWEAMRRAVLADAGAFHATIARRNLHWFVPSVGTHGAWLSFDEASGRWSGWDVAT
ncbi:MAG: hypothetical protein ABI650_00960, partial [Dokdonella sp.]